MISLLPIIVGTYILLQKLQFDNFMYYFKYIGRYNIYIVIKYY